MKPKWLAIVLLLIILSSAALTYIIPDNQQKSLAVTYLVDHFREDIGLIYESEDGGIRATVDKTAYHYNQTYDIYSDNLIAKFALKPYEPQISQKITQTIQSYQLPPSDFFEVLFGTMISEPLCNGETKTIKSTPDYVILAEFRNYSDPISGTYANALIYQSLNSFLKGNREAAKEIFTEALNLWDGKGINDDATKADGKYANYKMALILYESKILKITDPRLQEIEHKLWSMQQQNGGITSLANLDGTPAGSANAETTSMALLPYNSELISSMQSLAGKGN
jgi:hypothetical protein